jgi:hypothetical protein
LPEIWIPFGSVETLVTLQAENLGTVVEQEPEASTVDSGRLVDALRRAEALFVCDVSPPTLELLRTVVQAVGENPGLKVFAHAPKRVEAGVAELKGRVTTLPPPIAEGDTSEPSLAPELTGQGRKLFLGVAKPDPLFGLVDAKVQACLNWVAGSRRKAAGAEESMEPVPFQKTGAYDEMEGMAEEMRESTFFTVVPRGGKARAVLENPPFDAVKNGFAMATVSPARALVVGPGGRGYDDTLSSTLRSLWGALTAVRRSGSVLIVAECHEGLGSTALEMLATGRMAGEAARRKEGRIEGLEEVFYLNKLKQEFDVLLLSGLPETYAKSKLGLTTARGSGEAVGRLLNKAGRGAKVNVVPRGAESRMTST